MAFLHDLSSNHQDLEEVAERFPDLCVAPQILLQHETELISNGVPPDETRRFIHLRFVDHSARFTSDPLIAQRSAPINQTVPYIGWELDRAFARRNPTDLRRFTPSERAQLSYYVTHSIAYGYRNPSQLFEILGRICFVENDRYRRLLNQAIHRHRLSNNEKLYRWVEDFVIPTGRWKDAHGVLQEDSIYFSQLRQGTSYQHTCFLSTSINPTMYQFGERITDIVYAINAPIGLPFAQINALPLTVDESILEPEFAVRQLEVVLPPKLWLKKATRDGNLEFDVLTP